MEPARLSSSTGRRPYRSDSRPSSGANSNCISEYTESSNPTENGEAPNFTP